MPDTQENKFERTFNQILENEHPENSPENSVLEAFALRLKAMFQENETLRRPKETEWLQNLRQHKGIYDPETLALIPRNSSKVYPKITRARDNTVLSRLHEMLFPDKDRNWSIEPTPVPKVPAEVIKQIALAMVTQDPETGASILPTKDQLKQAIKEYAENTCMDMGLEMDDQLSEMDYSMRVGKPTLKSGVLFGTGIVKGPLPIKYVTTTYEATTDDVVAKEEEKTAPNFRNVKIWNWYPDMNVTEPDQQEGCFERHVMSKHEVRKLAKRKGFKKSVIKQYLVDHPNGDATKKQYEMDLEKLDEGTVQKNVHSSSENAATTKTISRKYEVLEYWGYVDGRELQAAGANIPEDMFDEELPAMIWLLGDKIIKAVRNDLPGPDIPYHVFYLEKDETSIFAEGLPRLTRHSQITICAASRMMLNNAAICSGPQFEINSSLVVNEDINSIFPMKVWVREGTGVNAQYPAIRVYHIESHINEYIQIIDQFIKFGDIESTLPTWMLSEPTAMSNETASGVSMRMSTLTMTIRDIVRNFDEHQEAIISSLYAWNMKYSDKPEIKGDYKVKARGSSSLVMKEVRMQSLNQFAQTLTPEDWVYIPRRKLLEERIKANDLDIELNTEDKADQIRQSMIDVKAKELAYGDMQAEIDKKKAMALNLVTKAKQTNNEPPKAGPQEDPVMKDLERQGKQVEVIGKVAEISHADEKHQADMNLTHAKVIKTLQKPEKKEGEKAGAKKE
jgi:hypothetical protein